MISKEFTSREKGSIKNAAKTIYPMYAKLDKLRENIEKLSIDAKALQEQIDVWEAGVKAMTGYTTKDLVNHTLVKAGVDKNGKDIMKSSFSLKYEETVVPPMDSVENMLENPNNIIMENDTNTPMC